jgi:hypothetical protein
MDRRNLGLVAEGGLALLIAACAATSTAPPGDIPEQLKPPPSQVLARQVHASGVQVYECRPAKDDQSRFEWQLRAPDASLADRSGKVVGRHYAGPTWEANDGSKVVGEVTARDNGPDAAAIPWLLLRATSTSGTGILSGVLSIQRLHTAGGKAPAVGCGQAQAGEQARIPYSADYLFYSARR